MDSSRFVVLCLGIPGRLPLRGKLSSKVTYEGKPPGRQPPSGNIGQAMPAVLHRNAASLRCIVSRCKRTKKAPQGKKNGPAGNLQNVHRNNIVF